MTANSVADELGMSYPTQPLLRPKQQQHGRWHWLGSLHNQNLQQSRRQFHARIIGELRSYGLSSLKSTPANEIGHVSFVIV